MDQVTIFKKLGLSDKEAMVYLKLLEGGASSVRDLAELTALNRGTVYDLLKKLAEAGLVSYFHKDTKQKFVAEDPEKLIRLLADRESELENLEMQIKEIIPELKSLQEKGGDKPVTKFYEGKHGVKFILGDILSAMKLSSSQEYYVYSAAGLREDIYNADPDFNKKRIRSKIKANTISLSAGGSTYGHDERRWLKTDQEKSNMTYIIIYADKCAFLSRDSRNNPVGVIIENKMIYETQRTIFIQLWNLLK
jgi:sugar-specific transcriptional regulator TrmB